MESFRERLNEIKRIIDEDLHRKRVLLLCQQTEPKSFDEYSSSGSFRRLEKFESSTYSEVLKAINLADNNKPVVMKIMRALSRGVIKRMPSITTKGCQSYSDILNELVVTQALSQLHDGVILNGQPNALYRTHFFCLIHEIKVVSGNLNRQLHMSRKRTTPSLILSRPGSERPPPPPEDPTNAGTTATEALVLSNPSSRLESSSSSAMAAASGRPNQTSTSCSRGASETLSPALVSTSRADLSSTSRANTTNSTISSSGLAQDKDKDKNSNSAQRQPTAVKSVALIANESPTSAELVPSNGKKSAKNPSDAIPKDADERGKFDAPNEPDELKQTLIKDDDMSGIPEEDRMLMEALPHEYVVSVMRHDGQPLWWMMTHKKLTPEQLTSVLVQVIVGLAIAENVYLYEHRDLHVSNILIKHTSNEHIPFILDGQRYNILSRGVKATIIDATFSRLTHNGKVYYRSLTSTLRAYGTKKTPPKMSLQNRSYRQMVRLTRNKWDEFTPRTNLIWLTYLCETLMKNEVMRADQFLLNEIEKIRDHTLKVKTTFDLLACFPFDRNGTGPVKKINLKNT